MRSSTAGACLMIGWVPDDREVGGIRGPSRMPVAVGAAVACLIVAAIGGLLYGAFFLAVGFA